MPIPEFIVELRKAIGTAPLWLSGVTAVVLRGEGAEREVLLVRRADNGRWTPVTGIIDPGEQPAVAAEREVLEEASVVAVAERLAQVSSGGEITYANGDRTRYLDLVFRMRYVSGKAAVGDDENTAVRWARLDDLNELNEDFRDRVQQAAYGGPEAAFFR